MEKIQNRTRRRILMLINSRMNCHSFFFPFLGQWIISLSLSFSHSLFHTHSLSLSLSEYLNDSLKKVGEQRKSGHREEDKRRRDVHSRTVFINLSLSLFIFLSPCSLYLSLNELFTGWRKMAE